VWAGREAILFFKEALIKSVRGEPFDPFMLSLSKHERAQDRPVEPRTEKDPVMTAVMTVFAVHPLRPAQGRLRQAQGERNDLYQGFLKSTPSYS
jgi:hypothetical protein